MKKNTALPRIQMMTPYSSPSSGRFEYEGMRLDFNERTVPLESAIRGLEAFVRDQKLQLYPEYFDLEKRTASYVGVSPEEIMLTNGTDQAIDVIFRTFADKDDSVVIPEPTFAMYSQYAGVPGTNIVSIPYRGEKLEFPLEEMLECVAARPKVMVICNPNNPTGNLVSLEDIERIAKRATDTIVYVDEAYFEFSGRTAVGLIKKYPNIIVTRTFSKAFGLAGLRVGYVVARQEYINEMQKVRGPFDVNEAAYYAASAVLADLDTMRRYAREVMTEAKPFVEDFFTRIGVKFYASAGNFILFRPDNPTEVAAALKSSGVLVRPQNKPGIEGSLRLTIGTLVQMKDFVKIYERVVPADVLPKYAFLDRDGTLIFEPQDTYQVDSPDKLRVLDGVVEGLRALEVRGYKLVMVSNQDGLGTPAFAVSGFNAAQRLLLENLAGAGISFEKVFICPHLPEAACVCRKPRTGMLKDFLRGAEIDRERSFVCGDRRSDADFARNLGLPYVKARTNGNLAEAVRPVLEGRL